MKELIKEEKKEIGIERGERTEIEVDVLDEQPGAHGVPRERGN